MHDNSIPSELAANCGKQPQLTNRLAATPYDDLSARFLLSENREFNRQYRDAYAARLKILKPGVSEAAEKRYGKQVPIKKLSEIQVGERCIIVGTLFKTMKLKPSILKDVSEENALLPQPTIENYSDPSDSLVLEDEIQRISLIMDSVGHLVSGIVVAVLGAESGEQRGKFIVESLTFKDLGQQTTLDEENEGYVALVSGLQLGKDSDKMRVQMLVDELTGNSQIRRLIVCGNSLSKQPKSKKTHGKGKALVDATAIECMASISEIDNLFNELSSCMCVDVMPGDYDVANHCLPQRPLHKCMFPKCSRYADTLHSVSNPYDCSVGDVRFLGTSGQPIHNIARYTQITSALDILENTLQWGHLAPTTPDTLGCVPYKDNDPFVIDECPHVYFSGNHVEFQHRLHTGKDGQKVLLLCVPSFKSTGVCVLVKLSDLSCREIKISNDFMN